MTSTEKESEAAPASEEATPTSEEVTTAEATTSVVPAVTTSATKEFVECVHAGGNWTGQAEYSDGSYGPHPDCEALRASYAAENPYQCPGTDALVPDPSYCHSGYLGGEAAYDELFAPPEARGGAGAGGGSEPGEDCPAAVCGYGVDANGNPNPTSGEIQTQHACETGQVTDPELCGAVQEKMDNWVPVG